MAMILRILTIKLTICMCSVLLNGQSGITILPPSINISPTYLSKFTRGKNKEERAIALREEARLIENSYYKLVIETIEEMSTNFEGEVFFYPRSSNIDKSASKNYRAFSRLVDYQMGRLENRKYWMTNSVSIGSGKRKRQKKYESDIDEIRDSMISDFGTRYYVSLKIKGIHARYSGEENPDLRGGIMYQMLIVDIVTGETVNYSSKTNGLLQRKVDNDNSDTRLIEDIIGPKAVRTRNRIFHSKIRQYIGSALSKRYQ